MADKTKCYTWDPETMEFEYEMDMQIDPIETELAGKTVYAGLPQNATYEQPLKEKDGFTIVWNGKGWEYKELEKKEKPEPKAPTELDKAYEELYSAMSWLNKHDYIGVKIATGRATAEEYADQIAEMNIYANKVNEAREKIKQLENPEDESGEEDPKEIEK